MEPRTILRRFAWVIFRQARSGIWVDNLFLLRWRWTLGSVHLGATEVTIVGTLNLQIIENALVVHALCLAAAKTNRAKIIVEFLGGKNISHNWHPLLELQIAATLVQTVRVLGKLLRTGLLQFAEKLERTVGNGFALVNARSRIVQLLAAQHKFLQCKHGHGEGYVLIGNYITPGKDVPMEMGPWIRLVSGGRDLHYLPLHSTCQGGRHRPGAPVRTD